MLLRQAGYRTNSKILIPLLHQHADTAVSKLCYRSSIPGHINLWLYNCHPAN